jgi:hypothetical protein
MDSFGQVPLGEGHRLEKLLQKHLSGVGGLAVSGNSNHRYLWWPGRVDPSCRMTDSNSLIG